jgi:hypothetical protein
MDGDLATWKRTWKYGRGHGDIDEDMDTWTHGVMEIWTWRHEDIETWRYGHGDM